MIGSLFISPQSFADQCPLDTLQHILADLKISGAGIASGPECRAFRAGEGFARHVVFAGCSPLLRFEPRDAQDRHFCHVALHGPYAKARLLTGENTVKPRCPHCRSRISNWRACVQNPGGPCGNCGEPLVPTQLDWRQHAAIGRCFVEFRNVFPGEASPSDQLLATLHERSGFSWRYAWAAMLDAC